MHVPSRDGTSFPDGAAPGEGALTGFVGLSVNEEEPWKSLDSRGLAGREQGQREWSREWLCGILGGCVGQLSQEG